MAPTANALPTISASRGLETPWSRRPSASAGRKGFGTSFLAAGKTDEAWRRWRELQGNFVDDPQTTVSQAHELVSELIDDIVHRFQSERGQLEQQWASGQQVSTEDLRHCFQRYRDFFGRLLANVSDPHH